MRTLADPNDRALIEARLSRLTPDSQRRWGRMTASQMICHLNDSFRGCLGDLGTPKHPRKASLFGRTIMKWWALTLPWPHGIRTARTADQERDGTRPTTFESDLAALRATTDRFVRELPALRQRPHYFLGVLSEAQWARWAYQHYDHHLKQFGV